MDSLNCLFLFRIAKLNIKTIGCPFRLLKNTKQTSQTEFLNNFTTNQEQKKQINTKIQRKQQNCNIHPVI